MIDDRFVSVTVPQPAQRDNAPAASDANEENRRISSLAEKHAKLMGYVRMERIFQMENRQLQARDEAYYDHDQLTSAEKAELEARGQAPIQHNICKPIIDWAIGTERRMRFDEQVLPRGQEDSAAAEDKSKLLKYLSDANRSPFEKSAAFSDSVKAGVGWIEVGIRPELDDGERLMERHVPWRQVYHDSMSRRNDCEDMRYQIRIRYVDLDVATAYFPEKRFELERAANRLGDRRYAFDEDQVWYMGENISHMFAGGYRAALQATDTPAIVQRQQVKLIEVWYREVQDMACICEGPWKGSPIQETDGPLLYMVQEKGWKVRTEKKMRVRVAIMTEFDMLLDLESPYRHNRLPLVPIWCYRNASTGLPYGMIRGIVGQNDLFNKLMSKAAYAFSTKRVLYESGAIGPDQSATLEEEIARPDAIIELAAGGLSKFRVETDNAMASQALSLAQIVETLTHNISGVTPDNLGRHTTLQSGRAIMAKQEQGSMVTAEVFDNLLLASQMVGELSLANIEQFYTEEKVVRIVGEQAAADFTKINADVDEDGEPQDPITASRADFIITERDARASMRQAMFEQLADMLSKLAPYAPDVVRNTLDVLVDMSDVPLRATLVKRIRAVTGQRDENEKITPEEQAAMQQQAQEQAQQKALMLAKAQAEIQKLASESDAMDARALKDRLMAMFTALEGGAVLNSAPQVGQTAAALAAAADTPGGQPPLAIPDSPDQPTSSGYVDTTRLNLPTR